MSDSLRWASNLLDSFYKYGVRHAIISPGSRSTPLTLSAAIHPGFKKHVVLDERSAGFIALGVGKATGMPAILMCTSGTAVANYMPAVVEAKESGVPMILLTADRPPNLRNLGSSQTVDQIKFFGDQTVFFHETGEPVNEPRDLERVSYLAKQAVNFSIESGGASQINLPFRKPLEPLTEELQKEKNRLENRSDIQNFDSSVNHSTIFFSDDIVQKISNSKKPLIIAGPSDPHHAFTRQIQLFANHLKAPVLAEPGSQFSDEKFQMTRFDQFIRDPGNRNKLEPDLIIRFGDQPYSSSLLWALEAWDENPLILISSRQATQDHSMSVTHRVICKKEDSIQIDQLPEKKSNDWIQNWIPLNQAASELLSKKIAKQKTLTDGYVFNYFSDQLSEDWNMILSNSLPARDMLTFGKSGKYQFVNRGAAGIDGVLSTALGIHFSSTRPTCCFIGDLAMLHDSNALYSLQHVKDRPFIVIIINNQGGNIFQMLPIHRIEERAIPPEIFKTYFQTPQKTDLSYLAKASHIEYQKIQSIGQLKKIDVNTISGSLVLECITDSKSSMDLRIEVLKG